MKDEASVLLFVFKNHVSFKSMNTHPRPDVRLASCRQILHYYKTLLHTVQNIRRTEKKKRTSYMDGER